MPAEHPQQRCQFGERLREIGIQRQDATVGALRRLDVTDAKKRVAQIEIRAKVIGLSHDDVAKFPDRVFRRAGFEMHHAQMIASGNVIRIDRERPLVSRDRVVAAPAVLQYIAEVSEIERIAGRGHNGLAQQRNRVVETSFAKRDEPGQVQRLRVLRIFGQHARIHELRFTKTARVMERERFTKQCGGIIHRDDIDERVLARTNDD